MGLGEWDIIIHSYCGSFPHSLLSTNKNHDANTLPVTSTITASRSESPTEEAPESSMLRMISLAWAMPFHSRWESWGHEERYDMIWKFPKMEVPSNHLF